MLLTAHQPNYLPYPGFFQKIATADHFLVVDTTQFVKRGPFGWIHRNRVRTPNGPIWLTLPVLQKGRYFQSIAETELNEKTNWSSKHWKSLKFNYQHAPNWKKYSPSLKEIYQKKWTHISPFNIEIIRWFMCQLDLHPQFSIASELEAEGKSSDYIISFCKELGYENYLSGIHGKDYLELEKFETEKIQLLFQDYTPPVYAAGKNDSSGDNQNLSLLDMLFWCGEEAVEWVHCKSELTTT